MYLFCVSAESIAGSPLKPTHARSLVKGDACSGAVPGASPIYFSVSLSFHGKPPLCSSTHHRFRHLLRSSYMEPRVF